MLFLFRHGDRTSRGASSAHEPDLSPRGLNQADQLRLWVQRGTLPRPAALWASPRIRALKTFAPLAQSQGVSTLVQHGLDERHADESAAAFRERVIGCLEEAARVARRLQSEPQEALYCCSHYDWLEEALTWIPADEDLLTGNSSLWTPGAFLGFSIQDGLWEVRQKGQLPSW